MYHKFSFYDLVKIKTVKYTEENDFFLHNYVVPKREDIIFEKKNNLIIILLESISIDLRAFADDNMDYFPHLKSLYSTYQHHEKLYTCSNTGWTIAALTSWTYGVPLKLPSFIEGNSYSFGSFLPNALSIFDIIKENGYAAYLFMGTSVNFSGTNYLFERGDFTCYDLLYYQHQNKIDKNNIKSWGIFDFVLYDELYKKYLEVREHKEPFILFMQTIDTHFPGFCQKDKVQYHDIRDSWIQADILLYDFLKKMEPFLETDNVSILIFGDHTPMGETYQFNKESPLFNLFIGRNVPQIPESKLTQTINPMDIAPTILQAAGAKWNNDQFGLGISIFSEDKSFSETEGITGLDKKLRYYSKFYDTFF